MQRCRGFNAWFASSGALGSHWGFNALVLALQEARHDILIERQALAYIGLAGLPPLTCCIRIAHVRCRLCREVALLGMSGGRCLRTSSPPQQIYDCRYRYRCAENHIKCRTPKILHFLHRWRAGVGEGVLYSSKSGELNILVKMKSSAPSQARVWVWGEGKKGG